MRPSYREEAAVNYLLFARPSFVGGTAYILDFGNTLFVYNDSPTPEIADYMAMKNDWVIVGDDLRLAIDTEKATAQEPALQPSRVG